MHTLRNGFWAALCVAALCVPVARGQQQDQSQDQNQQQEQGQQQDQEQSGAPIPAYKSPLASQGNTSENETNPGQLIPDTSSLSGFENFSVGMPNERSYWQPHAEVYVSGDSNGLETPSGTSWGAWGIVSGGVDVYRTSGESNLALSYAGGGMFSSQSAVGNGTFQNLSFSDRYAFHRVTLSVIDNFSLLPQDAFGFAGLSGTLIPGANGAGGLGSSFTPGQSILIGQGRSIANASDGEMDVTLSRRASLTFVGGYSLLHYLGGSSLLDYHSAIFRGGYNYQLSPKNTIAALYQFDRISYSNINQKIDAHSGELSYGRRVTGRLAFEISGGPQIIVSNVGITGLPVVSGSTGTGSVTQIGWTLNTSVTYQTKPASLSGSYFHGVTGGSGVLGGAITDTFTGSATRQVSRTFSGTILGGYSRLQGVPLGTVIAGGPSNQSYDYAFGGANISHPLSRALALSLSYQLQYQTSNAAVCSGTICGSNIIVHLISFGLSWRDRPRLF